jgi:hypothetical protein
MLNATASGRDDKNGLMFDAVSHMMRVRSSLHYGKIVISCLVRRIDRASGAAWIT